MILAELLSEVLGEDVIIFEHTQFPHGNGVRYRFNVNSGRIEWINIYELAHKCKEWAFDEHKYFLSTGKDIEGWFCTDRCSTDNNWLADTEPEAIFKACEYILKENK